MREQLIQYVNLLFAGAADSEEMKQEILQNTLDRYDDLVDQGKTPEAAYRLAISGIGDINEILGNSNQPTHFQTEKETAQTEDTPTNKLLRAIAVGLYILCPVPLIVLGELGTNFMDTLGLCGTLTLVAVATVIMILCKKKGTDTPNKRASAEPEYLSPRQELHKSVRSVIWAVGLAVYFILSFMTNAWYITWVIFPIIGSVQGLAKAIIDLQEANQYEN